MDGRHLTRRLWMPGARNHLQVPSHVRTPHRALPVLPPRFPDMSAQETDLTRRVHVDLMRVCSMACR